MRPAHKLKVEDIQEQCEALSNEQLLLVVNNKRLYTEMIVRVAYQEIRKRGLSKEEVKGIEKKHAQRAKIITGDISEDIVLFEKVAFFFLFFPRLHFLVLRDYRKKKFILKIRQAGYYNLAGAMFFLLGFILGPYYFPVYVCAIIWALSFLPAYAFNEFYFKQRTIKRLEARASTEEVEQPEQNFYP